MTMFVLTIDQVHSRRGSDRVPELLAALSDVDVVFPFERTLGDEVQGVPTTAAEAVRATLIAMRLGGWHIGIGAGDVVEPLPDSVREATGTAFFNARDAIKASGRFQVSLAVRGPNATAAAEIQAAFHLLGIVWAARTESQWQAVDLLESGMTGVQAAAALGISPQALSRRRIGAALNETRAMSEALGTMMERLERPE